MGSADFSRSIGSAGTCVRGISNRERCNAVSKSACAKDCDGAPTPFPFAFDGIGGSARVDESMRERTGSIVARTDGALRVVVTAAPGAEVRTTAYPWVEASSGACSGLRSFAWASPGWSPVSSTGKGSQSLASRVMRMLSFDRGRPTLKQAVPMRDTLRAILVACSSCQNSHRVIQGPEASGEGACVTRSSHAALPPWQRRRSHGPSSKHRGCSATWLARSRRERTLGSLASRPACSPHCSRSPRAARHLHARPSAPHASC